MAGSQQPPQKKSSDLTKCPNGNLLFSIISLVYGPSVCVCVREGVCVCVCVSVCMHACALVFYHTNSTLHRNPMCSNKALCGKKQKLHEQINSINARKSVFKAKKTEQSWS